MQGKHVSPKAFLNCAFGQAAQYGVVEMVHEPYNCSPGGHVAMQAAHLAVGRKVAFLYLPMGHVRHSLSLKGVQIQFSS
jgi:hypothetical protein